MRNLQKLYAGLFLIDNDMEHKNVNKKNKLSIWI